MRKIHAEEINNPFKLALVISRFNEEVTQRLYEGAVERLHELALTDDRMVSVWVPGAVEIPLVAQQFARQRDYAAVICLGAVIRGETSHYDYVCQQVSQGCQQVMLATDKPIIFGVLTTENKAQALDRLGGKHGHKGREAADCALEMISIVQQLQGLQ